ncbi:E3 SUMO-protein ligase ZBED1-like isoform X1 [Cotesia typhae]|uniref:E3 SUMO-protein ligase ZBED1-like isoform X1 n=1 Tax=Cotesia typhae TaxID=2053667 RepID=UPI003D68968B
MESTKPKSKNSNPGKIIKNTRKKKSSVWSFFIKTPKGGECKLCTKNIAAPGNTTNLKNHLKRSHYESYSSVFVDLSVNDRFEDGVEINSNKKDLNTQSKTFNSEQQRIDVSFNRMLSFKNGGSQHEKITNTLVFMIVKDDLPYMATEKQGLRMLLTTICPHYQIPSRRKITELIEEKAKVLTMLLKKKKLEAIDSFSMTADVWTETKTSRNFLGCTVHYVEENSLKTLTLDMIELTDRHTSENISKQFENILVKWNIPKHKVTAVVTDNGANMVKAVNDTFGVHKGLRCFAYSLNLAMTDTFDKCQELKEIIDKVHNVVIFFKSPIAAAELKKVQNSDEVLRLIQDVPTRWNSKFYMLERFLRMLDSIVTALVESDRANLLLSASDVTILREVVELLRPAKNITKRVSGQNYVTSSEMLYHLHYLFTTLSKLPVTTEITQKVKQKLVQSI